MVDEPLEALKRLTMAIGTEGGVGEAFLPVFLDFSRLRSREKGATHRRVGASTTESMSRAPTSEALAPFITNCAYGSGSASLKRMPS